MPDAGWPESTRTISGAPSGRFQATGSPASCAAAGAPFERRLHAPTEVAETTTKVAKTIDLERMKLDGPVGCARKRPTLLAVDRSMDREVERGPGEDSERENQNGAGEKREGDVARAHGNGD